MDNLIIRNIKKEDIPNVVDIQIKGWQTAYKGIVEDDYLNSMNREEFINRRLNDYNKNGFIVAELNGKIVGFCRFTDNNRYTAEFENIDCELIAIYVDPELKNRGIGKKIFEYVKKELIKKNKKSMIICCLKENEPSKKFYEKMGGKVITQRTITIGDKEYIEDCYIYKL